MVLALGVSICMPGMAMADYVQNWVENGLYGSPVATYQTWNEAEAFLISPGHWTGAGLSGFSAPGWTSTIVNPTYVVATGPVYDSAVRGNFYFTTSATDILPGTSFTWDWVLSYVNNNVTTIVGVQESTLAPGGGWTYTDLTSNPPAENRDPVPIPATLLLLASGLAGLVGLGWRKRSTNLPST